MLEVRFWPCFDNFSRVGLASGCYVRRFHITFTWYMFSNPTEFAKMQTPYCKTQLVFRRYDGWYCLVSSDEEPVRQSARQYCAQKVRLLS